jgi:hypothetical protein
VAGSTCAIGELRQWCSSHRSIGSSPDPVSRRSPADVCDHLVIGTAEHDQGAPVPLVCTRHAVDEVWRLKVIQPIRHHRMGKRCRHARSGSPRTTRPRLHKRNYASHEGPDRARRQPAQAPCCMSLSRRRAKRAYRRTAPHQPHIARILAGRCARPSASTHGCRAGPRVRAVWDCAGFRCENRAEQANPCVREADMKSVARCKNNEERRRTSRV